MIIIIIIVITISAKGKTCHQPKHGGLPYPGLPRSPPQRQPDARSAAPTPAGKHFALSAPGMGRWPLGGCAAGWMDRPVEKKTHGMEERTMVE